MDRVFISAFTIPNTRGGIDFIAVYIFRSSTNNFLIPARLCGILFRNDMADDGDENLRMFKEHSAPAAVIKYCLVIYLPA